MADTVNYEVDPNHERLLAEEKATNTMVTESNKAYDSAIANNNATQKELQSKIDANTADLQKAQQAQSDLAIQAIEQNKKDARTDYLKEQSGAYVDWQKQSNSYGANAEARAANGMTNAGYSESSQVAMYNQYQNRIATARESYTRAITAYNQSIAEAKAANSVALAEIASNALAQSLEIAMQFAMQNNTLLTQKAQAATSIRQQGRQNYLSVYSQLQDDAQFKAQIEEEIRQHNETMAENRRQFNQNYALNERQIALQENEFAWQKAQAEKAAAAKITKSSGSSSGSSSRRKSSISSGKKAQVDKIVKGKISRDTANNSKTTKSTSTSKKSSGTKSSGPVIDTNSLKAAGVPSAYSPEKLYSLVDKGELIMIEKNNKIYFYRNDKIGRVQATKTYNGNGAGFRGGR